MFTISCTNVKKKGFEKYTYALKNYFDNNWHPISDVWVNGYMSSSGKFLNRTINFREFEWEVEACYL